jgi:hypothetical protein
LAEEWVEMDINRYSIMREIKNITITPEILKLIAGSALSCNDPGGPGCVPGTDTFQ